MSDTSIMHNGKCFNFMKSDNKAHDCYREEKDWEIYCYDIEEFMCTRCGRWNHLVHECYASRDINGIRLNDNLKRRSTNKSWHRSNGICKKKK